MKFCLGGKRLIIKYLGKKGPSMLQNNHLTTLFQNYFALKLLILILILNPHLALLSVLTFVTFLAIKKPTKLKRKLEESFPCYCHFVRK